MFKRKPELEITICKTNENDWKVLEKLIKDNWEIKETHSYSPYFIYVTLTK